MQKNCAVLRTGAVTATSFSLDGRQVVNGSVDHGARVWESPTG
jgi:hypothetical protein